MSALLSTEIKTFLDSKIDSVDELEVLLLVRTKPAKEWDALEIARELRLDPITASTLLMSLYVKGLIGHQEKKGRLNEFCYGESPKESDRPLSELATLIQRARTEVIDYVTTQQRRQLQAFSDAFDPKKGK